jgi:hypothetical protein
MLILFSRCLHGDTKRVEAYGASGYVKQYEKVP